MNKSLLGTKESLARMRNRNEPSKRSVASWIKQVAIALEVPLPAAKQRIVTFNHPIMEQWNK